MVFSLRSAHRISACLVLIFITLHLINHLIAVFGVEHHINLMQSLRRIYRNPAIEVTLMLALLWQSISGLMLIRRRRGWKLQPITMMQVVSGAYLYFFMVIHVSAVWIGRLVLELDTNFHFAAAGLHVRPLAVFFVTYYFLAVLAVLVHLGCALYTWQATTSPQLARALLVMTLIKGFVLASVVTMALAGGFEPYAVPPAYLKVYQWP